MFNLCFRTLVLTIVLFCFMDNGIFFIFSSQDVVAAEKKKQMVAEQVMIDHLSRQALIEIHSESIHYISFLYMTSALEWSTQRFPYFSLFTALFFPTRLLAQQKYLTVLFTKYFLSKELSKYFLPKNLMVI